MREKHRLSAVALGTLLCAIIPIATHAQDQLLGRQERSGASHVSIEVQLLRLLPAEGASTGPADFVEQHDRTEVLVTLSGTPPDLVTPSLIAEIHEGTCLDLKSASVHATEGTVSEYWLAPSPFSLRSFDAILPVQFAELRSGAHAITVRGGTETGSEALACVDVA